jgi:hypothetical protein
LNEPPSSEELRARFNPFSKYELLNSSGMDNSATVYEAPVGESWATAGAALSL